MTSGTDPSQLSSRPLLRQRMLAARAEFMGRPDAAAAQAALLAHLRELITQLEPACLGLYWAVRSEFNAPVALALAEGNARLPVALPFVQKQPPQMKYHAWDGTPPTAVDEARIPCASGPEVTPDVVLVPCVGFTAAGYRLGYGGGYFDRWMAAHPQSTTVGIAWSGNELPPGAFEPQAHDQPLTLVLTERGVVPACA